MTSEQRQAVVALWNANADDVWPMSFTEFARRMEAWEVIPAKVDGRVVGGFIRRGPELHCAVVAGFGRWFTRRMYDKTIGAVLRDYGYAVTLPPTNDVARRFIARLGFKHMENGTCLLQPQL